MRNPPKPARKPAARHWIELSRAPFHPPLQGEGRTAKPSGLGSRRQRPAVHPPQLRLARRVARPASRGSAGVYASAHSERSGNDAEQFRRCASRTRGARESEMGRLEQAVAAYSEALKEKGPRARSARLGDDAEQSRRCASNARRAGKRDGAAQQAVAAYSEALKERTRERVPRDWAMTQNNLGAALQTLGERGSGTELLEQAVAAYSEALKERTRERVPLDWAMTQNNLGAALQTLGERESGTERLDQAVAAYSEALKERTRERVPLDWAMTRNNLGVALRTLGERASGTVRLEAAIAAFSEALTVLTREASPLLLRHSATQSLSRARAAGGAAEGRRRVRRHRERSDAIQGRGAAPGSLRRCAPRDDGLVREGLKARGPGPGRALDREPSGSHRHAACRSGGRAAATLRDARCAGSSG
jgi:tetratricopeptide (TPR) repeat protein